MKSKILVLPNRNHPAYAWEKARNEFMAGLRNLSTAQLDRVVDDAMMKPPFAPWREQMPLKEAVRLLYAPRKDKIDFIIKRCKEFFLFNWKEQTGTDYDEMQKFWLAEANAQPVEKRDPFISSRDLYKQIKQDHLSIE